MKKKIDKKIIVIIALMIVLIGLIVAYALSSSDTTSEELLDSSWNQKTDTNEESTITISKTGEITSALEENLELHATYYLEEVYVTENEYVEEGEKLAKYTNETYLLAPYDCIVTELNIPEAEGKCTNQHYITVKSINVVNMNISINETQIDNIKIGQEVMLSVSSINQNYTGYITKISSTASNGTFTAIATFENDGNLKIGMTGKCTITVI